MAYFSLKKEAAPGVDGETWRHYGEELERNLQNLSERLKRGAYRAKPVRRVYIAKTEDRKSTRLNSSHLVISYAVFCLKKKKKSREREGRLQERRHARRPHFHRPLLVHAQPTLEGLDRPLPLHLS